MMCKNFNMEQGNIDKANMDKATINLNEFSEGLQGIETEYLKLVSYLCGCSGFKKAYGLVTKFWNGREVGIDEDGITDIATGTKVEEDQLYKYITMIDFTEIDSRFAMDRLEALKNIDVKPDRSCIHEDDWSVTKRCI